MCHAYKRTRARAYVLGHLERFMRRHVNLLWRARLSLSLSLFLVPENMFAHARMRARALLITSPDNHVHACAGMREFQHNRRGV